MIYKFEELDCWVSARNFNINIFSLLDQKKLSNHWPIHNQLASASLSIMNNIAEGYGRIGIKDRIKFFNYSHASCNEVKSMLYLINELEYITKEEFTKLKTQLELTQKLTLGYIRYLNNKNP